MAKVLKSPAKYVSCQVYHEESFLSFGFIENNIY